MITKQMLPHVSQHFLVRQSSISILSQRTVMSVNLQEGRADERVNASIVRQFRKWSNWLHKKLPHLTYFALATNYFNVFMSTTVLLGLTSFEKIGGQWIFGGPVTFQIYWPLGQWLQELKDDKTGQNKQELLQYSVRTINNSKVSRITYPRKMHALYEKRV